MSRNYVKKSGELIYRHFVPLLIASFFVYCGKDAPSPPPPPPPPVVSNFDLVNQNINGVVFNSTQTLRGISNNPSIRLSFSDKADRSTVSSGITFYNKTLGSTSVPYNVNYQNSDSVIVVTPVAPIAYLNEFIFSVSNAVKSVSGKNLSGRIDLDFITQIDSTNKFPLLTDSQLLDSIQRRTFAYFWDFGHPVSGLARERNTSGETVTSGGSGFGIMCIIAADSRGFITHAAALQRMQKIVTFLKDKAQKFHGAFPHWLNGTTGAVIPFSTKDNGADLVETSYLVQGLLSARQYFNAATVDEVNLRNDINTIWNGVEWDWFRRNNEDVLYWHWSPNYNWDMNMPIKGWNECLITYALAASSTTHSIPKSVYDKGWASNGAFKNGNTYYGVTLPLGPAQGGPLFFAHYSFLGINPTALTDAYANYWDQNRSHTLINYNYCVANPKGYYGYSSANWGLTASDDISGYSAHSPTNDNGVISPTAALSSFPYTPTQSMQALKFFYYTLGDKLWKEYGFIDAFSLHDRWFANSFLAIDQGPIIVMIENYRTALLWNLFMSCPEVKTGMKSLGFSSPNL